MTISYPQAVVVLNIIWEDFKSGAVDLQKTQTLNVLPKRLSVRINNYKEADEFDFSFDYRAFPFDPRLIRSIQVSIHIENMKKIQPKAPETGDDHNTVIVGFVDKEEIEIDENSKMINMKGRDFTSLYVDTPWTGAAVNLAKPVDEVVTALIKSLPTSGKIKVVKRSDKPMPVLSKVAPDLGELSGKRNAQKKESYWEVIQEIADKSALLMYIELDKLVIEDPHVQTDANKAVNFFYGHNVKSIQFERKIGRMKGFNVRVRAIIGKEVKVIDIPRQAKTLEQKGADITIVKQDASGQQVKGALPADAKGPPGTAAGQAKVVETAPFMSFAVSGIASEDALIAYGEKVFLEISRQQIEGRMTTMDMKSFTNYRGEIDLTKIRNGAAISVEIAPQDMAEMRRETTAAQREKYLLSRGYPSAAAKAMAENFGKFATPFYVRDVEMSFDSESGWKLDLSFINRIQVKA